MRRVRVDGMKARLCSRYGIHRPTTLGVTGSSGKEEVTCCGAWGISVEVLESCTSKGFFQFKH